VTTGNVTPLSVTLLTAVPFKVPNTTVPTVSSAIDETGLLIEEN
jgi:hypothetical protein